MQPTHVKYFSELVATFHGMREKPWERSNEMKRRSFVKKKTTRWLAGSQKYENVVAFLTDSGQYFWFVLLGICFSNVILHTKLIFLDAHGKIVVDIVLPINKKKLIYYKLMFSYFAKSLCQRQ